MLISAVIAGCVGVVLMCIGIYVLYSNNKKTLTLLKFDPSTIGVEFDRGNLRLDIPRKDIANIVITGDIIHIDGTRIVLNFRYVEAKDIRHIETLLSSFGYRVFDH